MKQICNGGEKALEKMTLTDLERGMLRDFVRFYDVEKIVEGTEKGKRVRRELKL